jgi:hypothetical protein
MAIINPLASFPSPRKMRVPEASMKLVAKSGLHYLIVFNAAVPNKNIWGIDFSRRPLGKERKI